MAAYRPSQRAYPCALREPTYPLGVACVACARRRNQMGRDLVFVSEVLIGEQVAIEETDNADGWFATPTSSSAASTRPAAFAATSCHDLRPVDL